MIELKDQTVLVTGSSRGIGAGIAQELAALGAKVIVTYSSSPDSAKKVFDGLAGDGHMLAQLKVGEESSVKELFSKIKENYGSITGLVNNAGITKDQLLLRMTEEDFSSVINVNLKGSFLCTKHAVKMMMKQRNGSIVNITSVIGLKGNAGQVNYAASKAGTDAITRSVAQEVGSRSIRVNSVAPGFIVTDMTDQLTEEQKADILADVPLNTLGTVADVANAVAFLLSDKARYITGHTLSVNGGMYM